ncbi:helix-turn-helix transcriptional regulator [Sphingobium sp.]|uniref:helix-turn-helix transcriptional regulator n=1 Tax=Sphingobium sp. TaxID=1912891 RepID=UPI003B3BB439
MTTHAKSDDAWADLFLSAALAPEQWGVAIKAMADATSSRHGQLIGFGPGGASFNWISEIDPGITTRYTADSQNRPDHNFRVGADQVTGRPGIVHEAHYDIARQSLRSDEYLDMCSDFDIFDGCQTRLVASNDQMVGLALLRDGRNGRTSVEERELFGQIAGHARAAVRLQQSIEHQGFALLSGTFEAMDRACWLLDATGRVGGMTPRADALLASSRLRVSDGWLASERAEESRAMVRAMRGVIGSPVLPADPLALPDDAGGIAIMLEYHPLPRHPWAMSFAPRAIVTARVGEPTGRHVQLLTRTFRLTPAEADIAIRLSAGQARPAIASARGVSIETLKVQIRSIYDKTGCNRESQLVRMIGMISH